LFLFVFISGGVRGGGGKKKISNSMKSRGANGILGLSK
jgi:hypothetical protein